MVPEEDVLTLPHYGGHGCEAIGIVPEDIRQGIFSEIPQGFNPLPSTYPSSN
jgi:phospholipase C